MSRSNLQTGPVSGVDVAEFKEGLKWLEEHGIVLIIPASRTRDQRTRLYLLVDLDRGGRSLVDVHDPLWIRKQERRLGIPKRWLARRIKSLTERAWLAPQKEGRS